ncbi:MAG: hypothetical protein RLY71_251 [Pseudomonadota bacterium]|jgi:hypothetical protein
MMDRRDWTSLALAAVGGLVLAAAGVAVWPGSSRAAPPQARPAAGEYRELKWDALIPSDWDPTKRFRQFDLANLSDSSPQADAYLKQMRETWDNAPVKTELNGTAIRLPGYLVPLEESRGKLQEFLLVPYFGACIHSPPPPANQIIHVVMDKPVGGFKSMDAVWVSGILSSARRDNADMGVSGYRLQGIEMRKYVDPLR